MYSLDHPRNPPGPGSGAAPCSSSKTTREGGMGLPFALVPRVRTPQLSPERIARDHCH